MSRVTMTEGQLRSVDFEILYGSFGADDPNLGSALEDTELGVFTAAFTFPSVPRGRARLRVGVTATHSRAECDELIEKLLSARDELPF